MVNKQMNKQNNLVSHNCLSTIFYLLSLQAHARLLCKFVVNLAALGLLDLTEMEKYN